MNKKQKTLSDLGYTFGLGAFRRYKELTGGDLDHFNEALKPAYEIGADGTVNFDKPIRQIDDIEAMHRWAAFLHCANATHVAIHGGTAVTIDEMEHIIDISPQEENDTLIKQYLGSAFLGQEMSRYYGIPDAEEPEEEDEQKKKVDESPKES